MTDRALPDRAPIVAEPETPEALVEPAPPRRLARFRGRLARGRERLAPLERSLRAADWAPLILALLILLSFFFRVVWLDKPEGALIFDEKYYVNAARVILGLPVPEGDPYRDARRGLDPNSEHPPGAKLIMAASMRLLGDNAWGWRAASVIFGTLSIPFVYGIARRAGGGKGLALTATFLYAFDNLVFVHARIGVLDVFLVAFLLAGVYAYLSGHPILAGLAIVAATLCKIGGLYGLGALVAYEGLRVVRDRLATGRWAVRPLRPLAITLVVFAVSFPWLLGTLDTFWSSYKNPVDHVRHIFSYGFALTRPAGPQGQESDPWQWLLNDVEMTYLRTDVQELENGQVKATRPIVFFRGAMNPYIVGIVPLAIGYAAYAAWRFRTDGAFLALALFVAAYAPFWPAALLAHRISYIFYFLPAIPAVALAAAQFLHAPQTPRLVRWAFLGAVLLGFYGYFPFRVIPS